MLILEEGEETKSGSRNQSLEKSKPYFFLAEEVITSYGQSADMIFVKSFTQAFFLTRRT